MPPAPTRSLKHEYELFVEHEIENYKESVPRSVLLGIAEDAVTALAQEQQLQLTELLLCEKVDAIIFKRLRLPAYQSWRRRQQKLVEELRRPGHWGLRPDDVLVRALQPTTDGRVLVTGASDDVVALYLAAHGTDVTAIAAEMEIVERVMQAAIQAGLAERVHAQIGDLTSWRPGLPLNAVIVSPAALNGLSSRERARVIGLLQTATLNGGVHLVQTVSASSKAGASVSLEELRKRYRDWDVTVEPTGGSGQGRTFLARKGAA